MSKFAKITGIIIAALLALGLIMVAIGTACGGVANIGKGAVGHVSAWMNKVVDWDIDLSDLDFADINVDVVDMAFDNGYTIFTASNYEMEFFDVQVGSLDVDLGASSLEIKEHDSDLWKVSVDGVGRYQIYEEDGVLNVKAEGSTGSVNAGTITIYAPKGEMLDNASFEVGAGSVEIDWLDVKNLDFEIGAGEVIISDGIIGNMDVEIGMGAADVHAKIDGNVNAEVAMGEFIMKVRDSKYEDHNYEIECAAGEIEINGQSCAGVANEQSIGFGASSTFSLECAMGAIEIEFVR